MNKTTLDTILERAWQGEGLNKSITDLDLPLDETLNYMQTNHKGKYTEAKAYAVANNK